MTEENKRKNKIIGISIGILVVLLVVISSTYAYWQITRSQEGTNDIIAACLDISYGNESGTFGIDPAWPISDNEGLSLTGYTFTVTNNCEEDVNYIIGMDSLEVSGASYLDYSSIKVSIDNSPAMIYSEQEEIGHIEENDVYTIRDSKKMATSVVKNGTPNTHNIKVWIKSDAPITEQSKTFSGRMFVTGGQMIENDKPLATLIATGDISKTEDCNDDGVCVPVTGNNVKYYLYSDETIKISGTGNTKGFIKDNNPVSNIVATMLVDYVNNSGKFTQEEKDLINNAEKVFVPQILPVIMLSLEELNETFQLNLTSYDEVSSMLQLNEEDKVLSDSIVNKLIQNNLVNCVDDVIIDEGVTSIGAGMFIQTYLDNIIIADSVTTLEKSSLSYSNVKNEIKMSSELNNVGYSAFYYLNAPNTIIDLSKVTQIGHSAFEYIIVDSLKLPTINEITEIEILDADVNKLYIPENIQKLNIDLNSTIDKIEIGYFYGPERTIEGLDTSLFNQIIWNYTD